MRRRKGRGLYGLRMRDTNALGAVFFDGNSVRLNMALRGREVAKGCRYPPIPPTGYTRYGKAIGTHRKAGA